MPILKSITTVKQYLAVSNSNTDGSLPKMQAIAEQKYLLPVLGSTLLATLQIEADTLPSSPSPLLKLAQQAATFMGYYEELPFIDASITDAGLRSVTTDKMQGAYRYQKESIRQSLEDNGLYALELLYQYLMANTGTYTAWATSDAYKRMNRNIIKTGTDFTDMYHLAQPYRSFNAMQPLLQEVEDLILIPAMGESFYKDLVSKASPSTIEKDLIIILKKAAANITVHKACTKLSLAATPNGIMVMLGSADNQPQGQATGSLAQINTVAADCLRDGSNYLNQAIQFCNSNASVSILPLWFGSDKYKVPGTVASSINGGLNGVFV